MEPKSTSPITLPAAIIIAGALIAIAIIWIKSPAAAPTVPTAGNIQNTAKSIAPITASDHILGNPNAKIKIIEYSDPSCPYCKIFDPTMQRIISEYGPSGNVAWVYRHFPLDKPGTRPDGGILHPNSGREAQAMECAAVLGGNEKFWAYEKEWYDVFPQDGASRTAEADQKQLSSIASTIGLNVTSFNDCLSSEQTKSKVEKDYLDGLKAGIQGTPSSFIITPSGSNIPLEGAQSYTTIKSAIDALLSDTSITQ